MLITRSHKAIVHVGKDIGVINKIELSHDNTGNNPNWFLDKVNKRIL